MAAQTWTKTVPATAGTTAIPLAFWQLIQEAIPVYKALITTADGGVTVNLPAAFTAQIATAAEYGVTMTKQSVDARGGELQISNKTTSSFKVVNTGSAFGESVMVLVHWLPA